MERGREEGWEGGGGGGAAWQRRGGVSVVPALTVEMKSGTAESGSRSMALDVKTESSSARKSL